MEKSPAFAMEFIMALRLDKVEQKQLVYRIDTNKKFEKVFRAIESSDTQPKQGIFFDGQVFDAYTYLRYIR